MSGWRRNIRCRIRARRWPPTFIVSVVVCTLIQDLPRTSFWRMLAYQAPYFAMQLIGVWIVGFCARGLLDTMLLVVPSASALQFLSKPFLMVLAGGNGRKARRTISRPTTRCFRRHRATIFAISVALLMLVIMIRDILADVPPKSETDYVVRALQPRWSSNAARARPWKMRLRQGQCPCRWSSPTSIISPRPSTTTFGHAKRRPRDPSLRGVLEERGGVAGRCAARLGGEEFAIIPAGL